MKKSSKFNPSTGSGLTLSEVERVKVQSFDRLRIDPERSRTGQSSKLTKGFTLPELLIVMAILSILLGFTTPSLLQFRSKSVLNSTVDTLVSDLKAQQTKAMVGDTEGRATADYYSVRFDANRYTLFHGTSYDPLDSSNFNIDLDPSLTFSNINVPNSSIIFSKGSGDVWGFISGSDKVTLTDSTNNEQKIIQINIYGAITVQ